MADKFFAHPQLSDKSVRRYAGEDVASWVTSVDDSFGRSKAFTLLAALWSFSASVQGNAIDFQTGGGFCQVTARGLDDSL